MRAVVTRVSHASVTIDGTVRGEIGTGFLVLLGITHTDTAVQAKKLADKICSLRIFTDENDKMNLGLETVNGSLLVISQFTLYGDCRKGKRPNFMGAAKGEQANRLYKYFVDCCRELGVTVQTGVFGADMKVELLNDGPVTILMDTDQMMKQ